MAFGLRLQADPPDAWILERIKGDEQHLEWALRGQRGYNVDLLPSAKWYTPFFLEYPSSVEGVGETHIAKLDDYFSQERERSVARWVSFPYSL